MSLPSSLASLTFLSVLTVGCANAVIHDGGNGGSSSTSSSSGATSSTSGAGGGSCMAPASPASFETGTGETCLERLATGQTVPVMAGPQGGFHVWAAIGCSDCGLHPTVEYGIKDPATTTWYAGTYPTQLVVDLSGAAWPQRAGLTAFLPGVAYDTKTQLAKGTHVVVSARVIASDGSTVHQQEFEVVLGDTMQWNPPCDPNPMSCGLPGGQPCCTLGGK